MTKAKLQSGLSIHFSYFKLASRTRVLYQHHHHHHHHHNHNHHHHHHHHHHHLYGYSHNLKLKGIIFESHCKLWKRLLIAAARNTGNSVYAVSNVLFYLRQFFFKIKTLCQLTGLSYNNQAVQYRKLSQLWQKKKSRKPSNPDRDSV